MKAQRLKSLQDFLKRAEIIPQTLLVITHDESMDCSESLEKLRDLHYDVPFYELSLSDNPQLKDQLSALFNVTDLPTFVFFQGVKIQAVLTGPLPTNNFSQFFSINVHLN